MNALTLSGPAVEGVTEALCREAVDRISTGDPSWLRERRLAAWDAYERTPMPTTRLEEWRYTDLSVLLRLEDLSLPGDGDSGSAPAALPPRLLREMAADEASAGRLVILNGRVVSVELDPGLAAQGVVLTSLRAAAEEQEEMVRRHLATEALPPSEGKFPALNAALWRDGVFLHVPKGVQVDRPIRVSRWIGTPGEAFLTRTLVIAERESRVSIVDEMLSDDLPGQTLLSSAVEVLARDGAQVQYVSLQRMGRGVFHQAVQRTLAGRDATLDTLNVSLGASVARLDLHARLLGPGANSDMLGLYFADGDQHFDHNTRQDHEAPHTNSDLLYKGALEDRSRAVFRGIIRVHPGAQRTDAYQTNRNLLLSPDARVDSLPNLEIEADDVKCSHGATVGQLDADALFYLMSRGMSRRQAERLVVQGFLGEVLGRLPLGGVTDKVLRVIQEKLDAHG